MFERLQVFAFVRRSIVFRSVPRFAMLRVTLPSPKFKIPLNPMLLSATAFVPPAAGLAFAPREDQITVYTDLLVCQAIC